MATDDIYSAVTHMFDYPTIHTYDGVDYATPQPMHAVPRQHVAASSEPSATSVTFAPRRSSRRITPRTPAPGGSLAALPDSPLTPIRSEDRAKVRPPPAPFNLPPTPTRPATRVEPLSDVRLLTDAVLHVSRKTRLPSSAVRSPRDQLYDLLKSGQKRARDILLAWVTREPVALPHTYTPSHAVQRAFDALKSGTATLDTAFHVMNNDVLNYVDDMKSHKRKVHKARLRAVEPLLEMSEREAARHRVEAGLTKFKNELSLQALRASSRWIASLLVPARLGAV